MNSPLAASISASSPGSEPGRCARCGQALRAHRLGARTFSHCVHCAAARQRAVADPVDRERSALERELPIWRRVGVPPIHSGFSLQRVFDVRPNTMPPASERTGDLYFVTSEEEIALVRLLRSFTTGWGYLGGSTGCGKSLLAAGWALDRARAGLPVCWWSERKAAPLYAAQYGTAERQLGDLLIQQACDAPMLVWDDFAYLLPSRTLRLVIGVRYERRVPTLFTSNLRLEKLAEVAELDQATIGRLVELCSAQAGGFRIYREAADVRILP